MTTKLMAAINRLADQAGLEPERLIDRMELARELHSEFSDTPVIEIVDKLNIVWRKRGLSFSISKPRSF